MRKMQRAGTVLIVLAMTVSLLSCRSDKGTYVNTKDSTVSLELKGDGTFAINEKGKTTPSATGTYKVAGTVITFTLTGINKTGTGKLEGDTLTDPDGTTWKKQ